MPGRSDNPARRGGPDADLAHRDPGLLEHGGGRQHALTLLVGRALTTGLVGGGVGVAGVRDQAAKPFRPDRLDQPFDRCQGRCTGGGPDPVLARIHLPEDLDWLRQRLRNLNGIERDGEPADPIGEGCEPSEFDLANRRMGD